MVKSRLTICILLLIAFSITGCSKDPAKSNNAKDSSSEQPSVVIGNTYVNNISEQTFYCMRVKGNYYKIYNTDCSADLLTAGHKSLFPKLKDGQVSLVTADLEVVISDFGFIPNIMTISTEITDLKSSEPIEFKNVIRSFNPLSADSEEINDVSNLFQYTHNGDLYLIFVYNGQVTAYSEEGLFVDYELEDGEDPFKRFFEALK